MIMLFFYSDTSDLNRTIIAAQWEAAVLDWVKSGASEFSDMTINVIGDKVRVTSYYFLKRNKYSNTFFDRYNNCRYSVRK
jgi:hypothetical protein